MGVIFHVHAFGKLQKQLAEARQALADEVSRHKDTTDFLDHQTNARADAEARIEELEARLQAEQPEEESPSADETNSPPIAQQPEDSDPQNHSVDESARTIVRLTKDLEELQADFNAVVESRDTWRQRFETLEAGADAKVSRAIQAIQDQRASDNAHNEQRIGALETQLEIEKSEREQAQAAVHNLRNQNEKLQEELSETKAQYESLEIAHRDLEARREAGSDSGAEPSSEGATSTLDGSAPVFIPSLITTAPESTVSQDTGLPLHSSIDAVQDTSDLFAVPDDELSGSFNEDYELPDATSTLEYLQSLQPYAALEDPFQGEDPLPEIVTPEPSPAPRAAGPGQTKNPHIQKLNEEVMRREWRRKSGMEGSEEEEGIAGPVDVHDGMYDRQVAQALTFSPTCFARGSMYGALNDDPDTVEPEVEKDSSANSQPSPCPPVAQGSPPSQLPAQEPSPLTAGTHGESSPAPQGRSSANYWAAIDRDTTKTFNEEVGDALSDALADLARKNGLKTLRTSMWATEPESSTKTTPQRAPSPPVSEEDKIDEKLPEAGTEDALRTHNEEVGGPLANFIRKQADRSTPLTGSIWATGADASSRRSRQGASPAAEGVASPRTPAQPGLGAPPQAPTGPRNSPAATGVGSSSSSTRGGHERGRGGRGRGRGGPATPAPAPGAARGGGPRSSAPANDSFRRFQERMAGEGKN